LGTLSSAVIAIAFIGQQAKQLGCAFYVFALTLFVYQIRRFQRAAAVVPEMYDWDSLFMFGAANR
jgi:hypothetical protein